MASKWPKTLYVYTDSNNEDCRIACDSLDECETGMSVAKYALVESGTLRSKAEHWIEKPAKKAKRAK